MHKTMLFVLVLFCLSFLTCCDDCPTCPEPEPPTLGEYRLYAVDTGRKFLVSIDVPADTVIDSIRLDYYADEIFLTPGGEKLLVMRMEDNSAGDQMEIYNTEDLSHIGVSDQYGFYYFDGGDNYGIFYDYKKVYFIDPETLTPYDSIDTYDVIGLRSVSNLYLDTITNQIFLATHIIEPDSVNNIYRIDCISREIIDIITIPLNYGFIAQPVYNRYTNDLYFFSQDYRGLFFQYSLELDTAVVQPTAMSTVLGSITIFDEGRKILVTDGGNGGFGIHPMHPIWVFDASSHYPIEWIVPYDSSGFIGYHFGHGIASPDGHRLYLGSSYGGSGNPITIIDANNYRIIKTIKPIDRFNVTSMVLGPKF